MQSSLNAILSSAVVFQLLFAAAFLLFSARGNKLSNRLLGLFLLILSVNTMDIVLRLFGLDSALAGIMFVTDANVYTFGPLIFLYTQSVVYKDFRLNRKLLWHFIPWLAFFLLFTLALIFSEDNGTGIQEDIQSYQLPAIVTVIALLFYLHTGAYMVASFKLLQRYRKALKNRFAAVQQINLSWLDFMLKAFAAIGLIGFLHTVINSAVSTRYMEVTLAALVIIEFYFINSVLFRALKQPQLFSGLSQVPDARYADAAIPESELASYAKALSLLMTEKQAFLNADINVDILAQQLNLHPKKLSQVINRSFNKNFFDFINDHRIDFARKRLVEQPEKTVLEILYESGFNSKSSFNTAFRKQTGMTPSAYRKKYL